MAITRVGGTAGAGASIALPAHQAGDLILVFAYRDAVNTAPALPGGFTSLGATGGNSNSSRIGYKIAASSAETSGTWTNATQIAVEIYRGVAAVGVGAVIGGGNNVNPVTYPALTLNDTSGRSWLVGFVGHRSANDVSTAPSGMTPRNSDGSGPMVAAHDTNGGVSSWTAQTVTASTSAAYRTWVVEVIALATLTVADATHGHAAESPNLSVLYTLAVADAAHAHTAESPALSALYTLAVADATHGHTAEAPTATTPVISGPLRFYLRNGVPTVFIPEE